MYGLRSAFPRPLSNSYVLMNVSRSCSRMSRFAFSSSTFALFKARASFSRGFAFRPICSPPLLSASTLGRRRSILGVQGPHLVADRLYFIFQRYIPFLTNTSVTKWNFTTRRPEICEPLIIYWTRLSRIGDYEEVSARISYT